MEQTILLNDLGNVLNLMVRWNVIEMNQALLISMRFCNIQIFRVLIMNDLVDINIQEPKNMFTPLMFAIENNVMMNNDTLNKCDLEKRDMFGRTALMHAVFTCNTTYIKELCSRGANVNADDNFYRTPLLFADRMDTMVSLLNYRYKLDFNKVDENGRNVLMFNLRCNRYYIVKYLLSMPIYFDLDKQDKGGVTVLMMAVESMAHIRSELVNILINRGVNVNIRDNYGKTALMRCYPPDLLIEVSNIHIQDNRGRTALYWAAKNNRLDMCKKLCRRGAKVTHLMRSSNPDILDLLQNQRFNFNLLELVKANLLPTDILRRIKTFG